MDTLGEIGLEIPNLRVAGSNPVGVTNTFKVLR